MTKRKMDIPEVTLEATPEPVTAEVASPAPPEAAPVKPRRKKVAIIGFTPTRNLAPYQNDDYDIWCLNDLFESLPRYDRVYQIHDRQSIDTHTTRGEKVTYIKRLRELGCPIYMIEGYPDIPNSHAFPLDDIIKHFGCAYFTNSISYMIAHAIYEHDTIGPLEDLHIYGVDMAVGTEFVNQRPSCEYWLGLAAGRGIRIYLPNESDLLKARFLYGFERDKEEAFNKKCASSVKMMNERLGMARKQERELQDAACKYEGGIAVAQQILAKCSDEATIAALQNTVVAMERDKAKRLEQAQQVRDVANKYEGAVQAIGEIGRTWATCLTNPDPIVVQ
jgi:hypothetical protein